VPGSCVADVDAELEKTPSDIMRLLETASDAGVELGVEAFKSKVNAGFWKNRFR